ncbi:MAG: hypothetical protein MUP22_10020 [Desulfobacterales bacterium]|nr:hypothetical protein [Desulfobacterales bacterium]
MDITEFNNNIFQIIDGLNHTDIETIHKALYEKGCCENISNTNNTKNDQALIKEAIKKGIQKISMEDLESIAPQPIKDIIQEFKYQSSEEIYNEDEDNQDLVNAANIKEETQEQLVREAISISAQRSNDREEIPRDLQRRLGYIASKLNIHYKLSKRQITKLININHITVGKYITECLNAQPDLIKLWGQTAEVKSIQKIDDTMAKTAANRTINILKDSISIADNIREKYAISAAQKGYDLYNRGDLEKLVNSAVQLYFSNDSVYINIVALEAENARLRQQVNVLRGQTEELDEIKLLLLN